MGIVNRMTGMEHSHSSTASSEQGLVATTMSSSSSEYLWPVSGPGGPQNVPATPTRASSSSRLLASPLITPQRAMSLSGLFNFLATNSFENYCPSLVERYKVCTVQHLVDVNDDEFRQVGFTDPQIRILRKSLNEKIAQEKAANAPGPVRLINKWIRVSLFFSSLSFPLFPPLFPPPFPPLFSGYIFQIMREK